MKTLIELFDECQVENVISGLRFFPDKIVFVGFEDTMTADVTAHLTDFFDHRHRGILFEFITVDRFDFYAICKTLNQILDNNEDCYFDLTGGKELVLAAMGAVATAREIPMLQFDVETGEFIDVDYCDDLDEPEKASMTIEESVRLNGCCIVKDEKDDTAWDLSYEFRHDIETMWGICKKYCRRWNRQCMLFNDFEEYGKVFGDLTVSVFLNRMSQGKYNTSLDEEIIEALKSAGLLFDVDLQSDRLTYRYKNEQVRQCLTKPGNILELYALVLFKEIKAEEPDIFDDIDIGVYIDWDGEIYGEFGEKRDTKNEVDIMLMRNLIPIFVSCKNGEVHKEALYELSIVAEKFGGKYAKKYLLSSYVSTSQSSLAHIEQRAEDMGITLIKAVDTFSRDKFKNTLKALITGTYEE